MSKEENVGRTSLSFLCPFPCCPSKVPLPPKQTSEMVRGKEICHGQVAQGVGVVANREVMCEWGRCKVPCPCLRGMLRLKAGGLREPPQNLAWPLNEGTVVFHAHEK